MKMFETPEIEVINFAVEDIITASGEGNECMTDYVLCGTETPLG